MSRARILLADPNAAVLETLVDVLQPEFAVAGTVQSGAALLEEVQALNPDVVVLEVGMGDMTGFEVLRRLQARGCRSRYIFLSLYEGIEFVEASLKMGASAYVIKSSASSELPAALRRVMQHEAVS